VRPAKEEEVSGTAVILSHVAEEPDRVVVDGVEDLVIFTIQTENRNHAIVRYQTYPAILAPRTAVRDAGKARELEKPVRDVFGNPSGPFRRPDNSVPEQSDDDSEQRD
jgi:hypothetical protein